MLFAAAAGLGVAPGRADEPVALAVIDVATSAGGIQIVGKAVAISDARLSGEMTITRHGEAGSVSTKQSNELEMRAGQSADVARVGVSFHSGDSLEVKLVLTRNGNAISEAVLRTVAD